MSFETTFLPGSQKKQIIEFIDRLFKNKSFEIKSSGSTGVPKIFNFTYDQGFISASKTIEYFNLNKESILYLCLDIHTVAAKMQIIRAIVANCKLVCGPVSGMPLKDDYSENFDFISLVPMQLFQILKNNPKLLLNKTVLTGGAFVSDALILLIKKYNINTYESYGMTETLSHVALREVLKNERYFNALPQIKFSKDDRGCLVIEYPELNINNLKTNDMVELKSNNRFLLKGRFDFVINSGGIKLHPEIIEKKISKKLEREVLISHIKDQLLGEKLVLLIEGDPIKITLEVFSFLSKYEIPKLYAFTPHFSRMNSKINRIKTFELSNYEWRKVL